jgi:hypothetical protein
VNPDWEFRLFVADHQATALTIYNDFFYDVNIVNEKDRIQDMILSCWESVRANIRPQTASYCIDFAVLPDLSQIYIIEVNDFLPPIAGSGLFDYKQETDRALLAQGPFSFRIREEPLSSLTIVTTTDDGKQQIRGLAGDLADILREYRLKKSGTVDGVQDVRNVEQPVTGAELDESSWCVLS